MKNICLGAHLSIVEGFDSLFETAVKISATAVQIFLKSNRTWAPPNFSQAKVQEYLLVKQRHPQILVVAHANYLINFASERVDVRSKSVQSLFEELTVCDLLNIPYLILHPGSSGSVDKSFGLSLVIDGLNEVFSKKDFRVQILLENMAGQGSSLGTSFEELAFIRGGIISKKNIGYCLDTCHLYAFGYDLYNYKELLADFDLICGINNLKMVHVNDSIGSFGSKKDRHANIGLGNISIDYLKKFLHSPEISKLPLILETPPSADYLNYKKEIRLLSEN